MSLLTRLTDLFSPSSHSPTQKLRASILRRQTLLSKFTPHLHFLPPLLFALGLVWVLALPTATLGRGHYVSENALQPAQVNTYWNWADVHVADGFSKDVESWVSRGDDSASRARSIEAIFQGMGLKGATQSYSYALSSTKRMNGTNAYAILKAPKTDGAEALVLSASWLSRARDAEGERRVNIRGVAIVLALANFLQKYSMWSKDIVFVLSDGYSEGASAWLDAYQGYDQSNLEAEELKITTGVIWAALNIDYPHHSFDSIGFFIEGANGHLPNLDYLNTISHILKYTCALPSTIRTPSPSSLPSWLDFGITRTYESSSKTLWGQLTNGAIGSMGGPEGVWGKERIDAITLFANPAEGPHGFYDLGRGVESTFRSLNNLLERLHQSFFLYIMTSVDTFITVGNYLAAPILFSAGLTISGLTLWADGGGEREVGKALGIIAGSHSIGAGLFFYLTSLDPLESFTGLPTTIILNTAFLPLFTSFLLPPSPPTSSLTSTLKSFTLIAGGLGIAVVATLNFGLSLFLSLLLFLPLSLVSPRPSPIASRIQQVLLLLASPPVLWSLWKLAAKGDGAESWAREVLREYHTTSSWTLPVVFQFVVPLLLQASTLSLL